MSSYGFKHGVQLEEIHANIAFAAGTGKLGFIL
jgi:hypothetical protein